MTAPCCVVVSNEKIKKRAIDTFSARCGGRWSNLQVSAQVFADCYASMSENLSRFQRSCSTGARIQQEGDATIVNNSCRRVAVFCRVSIKGKENAIKLPELTREGCDRTRPFASKRAWKVRRLLGREHHFLQHDEFLTTQSAL